MRDVEIKLHIDPNVPPVVQPERRIPFHLRNKVADELKRLEENDIIEDATGPTPWVSPIVAAPKPKNPNEVRLCVDMRLPNQAIRRERHPSPTVDDIIHSLNGAKNSINLICDQDITNLSWHQNPGTSRPLPPTKDLNDTND